MKLILQNGYPYPLPEGFNAEAEGYDCREHELVIEGVRHFEWKYELTVEFKTREQYRAARDLTGWKVWDDARCIRSATVSSEDGYEHPAIVVNDRAYCGFIVCEE